MGSLIAHVAVVGIWIICALLSAGVGFMILRVLLPGCTRNHAFASIWIGLAGIVLFLQLWNFAAPVDGWALIAVIATGVAGLAVAAVRSRSDGAAGGVEVEVRFHRSGMRPWRWFVFTAVAGWLANRSLAPFLAYDSGVYMIPGVQWARAFPVVPGLGALHGRLAFNSSNVLLAALLEAGPWSPAAPHLLGGFFLFLLALRIWVRAPIGQSADPGSRVRSAFDLMLMAPLIIVALDNQLIPSLSADVSVGVAMFASVSLLLERYAGDDSTMARTTAIIGAVAALVLAVTMKLSAAPFALSVCVLAAVWLIRDVRDGVVSRPVAVRAVAAVVLVIGSWLARGTVLSGYPLYPSTLVAAPVSWRVPSEQAIAEGAWVSEFARHWDPATRSDNWLVQPETEGRTGWVLPWLRSIASGHDLGLVSLPLVVGLVFGACTLLTRRRSAATHTGWLLFCALLAFLAWMVVAPRPSFGFGVAWILAALPAGVFFSRLGSRVASRFAMGLTVLLCIVVVANATRLWYGDDIRTLRVWRWTLVQDADSDDWFREPGVPGLSEYRTRSGLVLNVTEERSLCWRAPLPCTPNPAPNISLRRAGDVSGGFLTDGSWQPERWPSRNSPFLEVWRARRRPQR